MSFYMFFVFFFEISLVFQSPIAAVRKNWSYNQTATKQPDPQMPVRHKWKKKNPFFQGDNDMDANESLAGWRLIVSAWDEEGLIM